MAWFVYILRCSDNSLYTGITVDIPKRIKVHNSRKGAKYLIAKLPVSLVYSEKVDTKSQALIREFKIKSLSKKEKEKIILLT